MEKSSRISYKIVIRLPNGKKKILKSQLNYTVARNIIQAEGCVVWIPSLSFLIE